MPEDDTRPFPSSTLPAESVPVETQSPPLVEADEKAPAENYGWGLGENDPPAPPVDQKHEFHPEGFGGKADRETS